MAGTKRNPKPRRRHRGEGSIFRKERQWKTKDGRSRYRTFWVLALSDGKERTGEDGSMRRKRTYRYFGSAAEAVSERNRLMLERGKPQLEPELALQSTLAEIASLFLRDVAKHVRPATVASYEGTLRLHVLPSLGTVPITKLSEHDLLSLYGELEPRVSPSMLRRVHSTLRALLNHAAERELIATNPVNSIGSIERKRFGLRGRSKPRVDFFEEHEIAALLEAAQGDRLGAIVLLALDTGARQGELFALTWNDVDFSRATVHFNKQILEHRRDRLNDRSVGEVSVGEMKTAASRRTLVVSVQTLAALQRRKEIASGERHRSRFVFPSPDGYALRKSNFLRRCWQPVCKRAGIPHARFHALRHTAASLALKEQVNVKVLQARLGHASVTTTLDVYGHLMHDAQHEAAAKLGSAFERLRKVGAKLGG